MEENSSKFKDHNQHLIDARWIPSTPAKPGLEKWEPIHAGKQVHSSGENWSLQTLSCQTNAPNESEMAACNVESVPVSDPAETQSCGDTMNIFDEFSDVPLQDLLGHFIALGTFSDLESASKQISFNAGSRSSALQCDLQTISAAASMMENQSHLVESRIHVVPVTPQCANVTWSSFPIDLNTPPRPIADASNAGISSQFEPVTPDQANKIDKAKVHTSSNLCTAGAVEGTEMQKSVAKSFEIQNHQCQLFENPSSATISAIIGENFEPEEANEQQTDMTKTPVKKSQRRKHRPKVIVEGQSKNTRNPRTPKPTGLQEVATPKRKYVRKSTVSKPVDVPFEDKANGAAEEGKAPGSEATPKSKRKYVRRKKIDQPTTPLEDGNTTTADSRAAQVTRRSCRKSLNFDIESQAPDGSSSPLHSYTDPENELEKEVLVEETEAGIAHDLTKSMNHILNDYLLLKEHQAPCSQTSCTSSQFMVPNQIESTGGKCQIFFSDVTHDKEVSIFKTMTSDITQATRSPSNSKCSSSASLSQETQARKSKRRRSSTTDALDPCNINAAGVHYNSLQAYQEIIPPNEYNSEETSNMHFPEIFRRKRSETFHKSASSSILPTSITTDYYHRHCTYPSEDLIFPLDPAFQINGYTLECLSTLGNAEKLTKRRSKGVTRVRDLDSLLESSTQLPISCNDMGTSGGLQGPNTCLEALADIQVTISTKKRSNRIVVSSTSSIANNHQQSVTKSIGSPDVMWRDTSSIDAIAEKLDCPGAQEQNPLVPYQVDYQWQNSIVVYQSNGTVVPFNGHIRKRRSRPKVDLDDETNRVWKLLLEDINSEGINGTDEQKAKWWEEEREVFRLRTESFIARMHLVQGDRRFTPWKGSVVDSVIGVFLTQNVSDHLSSSAFISMAARFPPKSSDLGHNTHLCEERSEGLGVLDPDDTLEWHKKVSNPPAEIHGSMILSNKKYNEEEINTRIFLGNTSEGTKTTIHSISLSSFASECPPKLYNELDVNKFGSRNKEMLASFNGDQRELDEAISSQNSVVSPHNSADSIGQTANRVESCSQSSNEAEPTDVASGCTSFLELLQMAGTMSHEVFNQGFKKMPTYFENPTKSEGIPFNFESVNSGYQEIDTPEESRFFEISKENELSVTEQSGLSQESSAGTSSQNTAILNFEGLKKFQSENLLPHNHQIPNKEQEIELVPKVQNQENHRICEGSNAPSTSESDLDNSQKNLIRERARNQKVVESNSIDFTNLVATADEINPSTSKAKRRKTNGKEKKEAINWDDLRKQAQNNGKREKTVETMDSVDWEAVRCADVEKIAQTIKERGMNNMLAERIKDFLNRIVREHEEIDLEWLRDIPPDQAKEFLLSIRGLGLKSVECVRLLTLHHLAFPVDTNVGRIAVRLGWVPLQPLPESLQLHLLELYPVLESIQKYLWPRLCKLDQPTLYELHYQMITFGKVFCTKSKPNCNACPMRAECRHFASAYASARLALPAPEERSIVSATEHGSANRYQSENINHLQLPQPEANQQLEGSYQVRAFGPIIEEPKTPEPIIEEPATPEPEKTQVEELDIEDTFHAVDEIPSIKLNIEELNQTLHQYMQQNIQVQEGEMSKALMVLNAEAASIPMPKLKSINRLRTEHQVYELPDTHPLLQGFDRREPDDPSHYLLAIWTPGETVNSIQPPESACTFQESGKLCNQETCFSCNSIREANTKTVRGTLLIPCRTAMRGSFPLNGTYFQVNEMFADHESSLNPIDVPRDWLWNLPRRMVYFGTSIPTIFKGLSQLEIQYCFWKGFVCVRGFDRKSRAPRPLVARLHFPASKLARSRGRTDE